MNSHNREIQSLSRQQVCQLSVVVPLFNEEESLTHLYHKIISAIEPLDNCFEIIFVDDGSRDKTWQVALLIAEQDPRLKVIRFRRNYGQTPAMAAGIDAAKGEIICTMDGDLQNDPADIPMMLDKMQQGYDLVVGWRFDRKDKLLSRKIPSRIANRLIAKVTGVSIRDNGCSLKLYRGKLMQALPFYSEMHRFIPALLSLSGAKVAEVKVRHHARQFGDSKYGISRTYKVLLDLLVIKTILSLKSHPVRWFTKQAIIPALFSSMALVTMAGQIADGHSGIVMATVGILCFSLAIFLVSLGFICEMVYQSGEFKLTKLLPLTAITSFKSSRRTSQKKDNSIEPAVTPQAIFTSGRKAS